MDFVIDPIYCGWDETSRFLIFSGNVFGDFIYYTHLLPIAAVTVFITILFLQSRRDPAIISLSILAISFVLWSFSDLVLWATANPSHTMFFWSTIIHYELIIYLSALYFINYYLYNKPPELWLQYLLLIVSMPVLLFAHTKLNLIAFDYTNCNREAIEGPLVIYLYLLELIISILIIYTGVRKYLQSKIDRRDILILTTGLGLFLLAFSSGNIVGTFQIDWELGQYGLLSLPVFMGVLTYMIVKYRSFNIKILGSEALVIGITILITSVLFVKTIENAKAITVMTIFLTIILGYVLIRSVHKEVNQREQIQHLANKLEKANARLRQIDKLKSEFVSIASHQLRSPLTSIRGYASLLREGSYGQLTEQMKEPVERIEVSATLMAELIEDYLNVSRIEAGNMQYKMSDFSLTKEAEKISDDLRNDALKKGLLLIFKNKSTGLGTVNADQMKTKQIIHNLLNNSIKYTPKGTIHVNVFDDLKNRTISIEIIDTGIGMNSDTLNSIFQKFERGDSANTVNVAGTGLGLYVAKRMAEAMGGTVVAHSDGEGKGSRFVFTLPLVS